MIRLGSVRARRDETAEVVARSIRPDAMDWLTENLIPHRLHVERPDEKMMLKIRVECWVEFFNPNDELLYKLWSAR